MCQHKQKVIVKWEENEYFFAANDSPGRRPELLLWVLDCEKPLSAEGALTRLGWPEFNKEAVNVEVINSRTKKKEHMELCCQKNRRAQSFVRK